MITPIAIAGDQRDVGDVVGAELRDELRPRDRLEDVVRRHRQERVGEHHDERDALGLADVDDGPEHAAEQATHTGSHGTHRPSRRRSSRLGRPERADAIHSARSSRRGPVPVNTPACVRRAARRGTRRRPDVPLRGAGGRRFPARQADPQRAVPRRVRRLQPRLRLRRGAAGADRGGARSTRAIAARVGTRAVVTGSLLFFGLNVLAFW